MPVLTHFDNQLNIIKQTVLQDFFRIEQKKDMIVTKGLIPRRGIVTKTQRKVEITQLKHKKKRRRNNPSIGLVSEQTEPVQKVEKKTYKYDKHLSPELQFDSKRAEIEKIIDNGLSGNEEGAKKALEELKKRQSPYLNWAGKAERTSFEVSSVSLHTHEKIDPRAIIEQVRKTNTVNYEQLSMFKDEQIVPENKAIDFYKHDKDWSNRLIAGDSLLVMNSLLEKEGMCGKIQCIYIDPPYGVEYRSNFQPFTNKREVKDKDKDLTAEPEMLKAFRDTWELGIHSYLAYMRDRLLLTKELLTESGSCFVQISEKNVHLIRNIMDEVFGSDNLVTQIYFATTSGFQKSYLSRVGDYIIWYAKSKKHLKYRQLFTEKTNLLKGDDAYKYIELPDGSRRIMSKEERNGSRGLPEGSKIFRYDNLQSSGAAKKDTPFEFNGKTYRPNKNNHWKAKFPEGMNRLKEASRIGLVGNNLSYIRFIMDKPVNPITNSWMDTGFAGFATDKKYVVETNPKVVQRCILMATDPGDIVFDPTCGSGTTAYVAEQWGRRWITCDTSRVAITLAKQRLMTGVFDYYKLANINEGIGSGFQYKTFPHVTLSSIANNEPPKEEVLYDQPIRDKKKARVTGPFTMEAVPSQFVQSVGEDAEMPYKYEWLDEVKKTGIRGKKGVATDMKFLRLEKTSGFKYLHAEGETANPRNVVISFGPEHAPLDKRHVELAANEVKGLKKAPDILALCAFHFDPAATRLINENPLGKTKIIQVQMNIDLQTDDLKKNTHLNESFWLIGSPDIKQNYNAKKDEYVVEVLGYDYYNPSSGKIESGGSSKIAMWMLDTDYDGRAVFPRQVFFPISGKKDGWTKLAKSLKTEIDESLIESYRGTQSLPFKAGINKKIAVKIIDDRGIESLKVIELSKKVRKSPKRKKAA